MCVCVCVMRMGKSHSDLESLHMFFLPDGSPFDLQSTSVSLCFFVTKGGGMGLFQWHRPKPLWGLEQALLFTYVHTRIHTHICVCQLIITNCSSHQALAKWPSLSDVARQPFPQTHTCTRATNLVKVLTHVRVFACAHSLPVCALSPPPYINYCPPSNEDQRTDSLKHLILPRREPGWSNGCWREREGKTLR